MMRRAKYQTVNGGVSLILLLFIILSLVTFAVLSIVSAKADARLSEKYVTQADQYYGAYNEVQNYLQGTDEKLGRLYERLARELTPGSEDFAAAYYDGVRVFLPELDEARCSRARFAVGETMELILETEILCPATAAGPFYRILQEETEPTVEYDYESTPQLIMQ